MSVDQTVKQFAELAPKKIGMMKKNPFGFFIMSMMAGAYVGIGIILILSVGEFAPLSTRSLIMGASFGVALTLVVFAGSELFTGYTMYMSIGWLSRRISAMELGVSWTVVWVGNLFGSAVLAVLAVTGNIDIISGDGTLLFAIAKKKAALTPMEMIARGILCNWLVCLALWTSARTTNDVAKLILIFWCLFAFIASGFEHSVANMTVFCLSIFAQHAESITLAAAAKNLLYVTLGNIISGALFLGGAYWVSMSNIAHTKSAADQAT